MIVDTDPQMAKISPEFASRLRHLAPEKQVRAIVMLRTETVGSAGRRGATSADRQVAIAAVRKAAEPVLHHIDVLLDRFSGRRLRGEVDALGCIPVEATPDGIRALTDLDQIQAVLEDQPISSRPAG